MDVILSCKANAMLFFLFFFSVCIHELATLADCAVRNLWMQHLQLQHFQSFHLKWEMCSWNGVHVAALQAMWRALFCISENSMPVYLRYDRRKKKNRNENNFLKSPDNVIPFMCALLSQQRSFLCSMNFQLIAMLHINTFSIVCITFLSDYRTLT